MPNKAEHLHIAQSHEGFSDYLITNDKHLDWAITGIFYVAIHYVEAYLDHKLQYHSASHRTRDSTMARMGHLRSIYDEFNDLKNDSIQARYFGTNFTLSDIDSRTKPSLKKIKTHVDGLLSVP